MSVARENIVTVHIPIGSARVAERNALIACKGGKSAVRYDGERGDRLFVDNLVGQLGMMAVCKYLHGSITDYIVNQFYANLYRNSGDGGHDLTAVNLDVKSARFIEGGERELLDYRLAVHLSEWHPRWIYVLAVVEPEKRDVHLVGWAETGDFPDQPLPSTERRFKDSYVLKGRELNRLPPFRWDWFPGASEV
jgi:hypothetical protein